MAIEKIQAIRGMSDMLPEDAPLWHFFEKEASSLAKLYGYQHIRTPIVEQTRLFKRGIGEVTDIVEKEMYSFVDSLNGDELSLRPENTASVVRACIEHNLLYEGPKRLWYMGPMFRHERPQRGRYRQFMQCDIDILGDPSNLAEIELILATTTTLGKLGFKNFQIRINERRILKAMAAYSGFPEESYDSVFITLDKMDKIGLDGVKEELLENGFAEEAVERYLSLFKNMEEAENGLQYLADALGDFLEEGVKQSLSEIIESVSVTKEAEFEMVFDPTLVRGMSYYTGTIFEIAMPEFGGSCGGGGRYDKMVGKFTGNDVPACGFSIGFERIILLLMESGFKVPGAPERTAYLLEKGLPSDRLCEVIAKAQEERKNGKQILVVRMNKNKKFQKEQLGKEGYTEFKEFYKEDLKH